MIEQYGFPGARVYEDTFFRADEMRPNVFKISQPWFKEGELLVYCFLIIGEKAALVYDSMFGYGNLRKFCESITDLPLILVDSHFHGDHAAGNFDFDSCYIHPYDMAGIYRSFAKSREDLWERAKATAVPEFADKITLDDICFPKPMKTYPIYDGDIFDLGGRRLEVIHVGGHSPGSIMLLDHENHIGFSGDTCNNDTIVRGMPGDPIEVYLQGMRHLAEHTGDIDTLFGGHEDFPATIIGVMIELLEKVVAGTDDRAEYTVPFPPGSQSTVTFGAAMKNFYRRVDGKDANVQYDPNYIKKEDHGPRILDGSEPGAYHGSVWI